MPIEEKIDGFLEKIIRRSVSLLHERGEGLGVALTQGKTRLRRVISCHAARSAGRPRLMRI